MAPQSLADCGITCRNGFAASAYATTYASWFGIVGLACGVFGSAMPLMLFAKASTFSVPPGPQVLRLGETLTVRYFFTRTRPGSAPLGL
jgi:hypothetical protein